MTLSLGVLKQHPTDAPWAGVGLQTTQSGLPWDRPLCKHTPHTPLGPLTQRPTGGTNGAPLERTEENWKGQGPEALGVLGSGGPGVWGSWGCRSRR